MNAVGQPISRIDGRLKVTGSARYTADIPVEAIVHGAIVYSTIANGRTVSIDTAAAENAPGVLDVLTHKNMPRMNQQSWSHLPRRDKLTCRFRTTGFIMQASQSRWWSPPRSTRRPMPAR
jgi:Aerobic-type carbon monoxide dehydrogenase, large subunit CoxL/CutL homologs